VIGATAGVGAGVRILVVDDEADIKDLLGELLESHGYEVVTAASAEEALLAIEKSSFDVVISDLRMTGFSGATLAKRIAQDWPALADRVILLTGDASGLDGDVPYLQKPFNVDEMLDAITLRLSRS
jgi:DNA-binding NtrC family response regulator